MLKDVCVWVLDQHMLPSRRHLFQGKPCVFQQDNAKPHTAAITTACLRSRRDRVLNWPACSPDLSPMALFHCMVRYGSVRFTFGGFSTGYYTWYLLLF